MKRLCLILILLPILAARAPKPVDQAIMIKMAEQEYWWGQSYDLARNARTPEARQLLKDRALADLNNSIRTFVWSQITHSETDSGAQSSSRTDSSIQISSAQYLQNVRYLEYTENKRYYVLAYLRREDFEQSERENIERIMSLLGSAITHEKQRKPGYLNEYLRTYLHAQGVTRSLQHEGSELTSWLNAKIVSELQNLPLKAQVSSPGTRSVYPVEISSQNQELASALLYDIPELGFRDLKMVEGKLNIFYEGEPSRSEIELQLVLRPDTESLREDISIREGAQKLRMNTVRKLSLNFGTHIKADWQFVADGTNVSFSPVIMGMSISSIEWDFGDGKKVMALDRPINHSYASSGQYEVRMMVNNDIRIAKTISITNVAEASALVENTRINPDPELPELVHNDFADHLGSFSNLQLLTRYLDQQKWEGNLVWGWLEKGQDTKGAWIVIVEPKNMGIIDLLMPESGSHQKVSDRTRVSDIFGSYKGKLGIYIHQITEEF